MKRINFVAVVIVAVTLASFLAKAKVTTYGFYSGL